jgi:hypothetical protein
VPICAAQSAGKYIDKDLTGRGLGQRALDQLEVPDVRQLKRPHDEA